MNMRKKIEGTVLEIGVTPNLMGFDYLCRAVEIVLTSNARLKIVNGLYEQIATEFGTTKSRVERAIRNASTKIDVENTELSKYISADKLTNSILIYTLAYILREG